MKSPIIQKPVAVILGNAGNIGYLAARAFACQGIAVAMLHESGEESSRVVGCLPGANHFAMSGRLDHSPDLASFAGACFCFRRHGRSYGFPFRKEGEVEGG